MMFRCSVAFSVGSQCLPSRWSSSTLLLIGCQSHMNFCLSAVYSAGIPVIVKYILQRTKLHNSAEQWKVPPSLNVQLHFVVCMIETAAPRLQMENIHKGKETPTVLFSLDSGDQSAGAGNVRIHDQQRGKSESTSPPSFLTKLSIQIFS